MLTIGSVAQLFLVIWSIALPYVHHVFGLCGEWVRPFGVDRGNHEAGYKDVENDGNRDSVDCRRVAEQEHSKSLLK